MELITMGGVVSLLLGGNIFFIKRLVDKIDSTGKANEVTAASVSSMSANITGLGNQLREIKSDIKDLRRLEIDVAVLKSQINTPQGE